ncbi:YbbR-like domain-containing protein [Nosocomiicoccus massiliensis]|uniref:CdaR family protein n=1 Tax=Nosocomiicoccus massiliensis TaxID=1232430 RepID=A0AAF0YLG1_9STAP|nr:CdaR family protein [Nosocomiicoccus massiliensis]WOS95894.1 CdaR family protein [Nosocomiicoccus massiliensis]
MLESKPGILIVSLILALFMFASANKIFEDFNLFGQSGGNNTITIENVPVELKYDEEEYYVTGAQKTVQVNFSGTPSKLKQIQATDNFNVILDLRNYELGEFEVTYEVEGIPEDVTATVLPKKTMVSIQNLVEQTFEVQAEVNESRLSSNYTIESITTDPEVVTVRGGEDDMARIQYVRAMISGTEKITDAIRESAEVSVFDGVYNKLDVVIEPQKVAVDIKVKENSKEVPVYLNVVGSLKSGYQLDGISLENETITIYGPQDMLDEIVGVEAEINLEDIDQSGSFNVSLSLPSNIQKTEPANIKAEVKISKK